MAKQRSSRPPDPPELGLFDLDSAPDTPPEPVPYAASEEQFPGSSPRSAVSIATLTQSARDVLEGAFFPLWVRGEVTDFKAHRNGHWYFCLRDAGSQVRCVIWSRDRRGIPAPPDDGMQVLALGQLTVYPARGEMQFSVRRLEAEGDGLWRKALERTRARLAAEGLLAPERKRPLPRHPRCIAVVTSPDGAALHDIASVLGRRAPHVHLVLVPAAVQGESAPEDLCDALDRVARWGGADLVIIGRGGGAREDLRAFNDERVARAVAACPHPTISAVGHEIDVTICDLVADHRAATPSAAAEAAARSLEDVTGELRGYAVTLAALTDAHVRRASERLTAASRDLAGTMRLGVERRQAAIRLSAGRLNALSPLATLARGFAVARSETGEPLTSAAQFAPGSRFQLELRDGRVDAETRQVEPRDGATGREVA